VIKFNFYRDSMEVLCNPLDLKQVVSFEELLMSQVVQQEALTRLLVEKDIHQKRVFEMVRVVDGEMKRWKKKGSEKDGWYFN